MRRPTPRRQLAPPEPKPEQTISEIDHYWAGVYSELIERFRHAPADWAVAMTAVRLYAKRVGFDLLLGLLEKYGVPMVAERCRREMTLREEFFARMLVQHPPDDPADTQAAIEEI